MFLFSLTKSTICFDVLFPLFLTYILYTKVTFSCRSDEVFEDAPRQNLLQTFKIAVLVLLWFICGSCLMFQSEKVEQLHQIIIPHGEEKCKEYTKCILP